MTQHLFDRLLSASERLTPVQSRYRVVFEDPDEPDAPAKVLVPDPNWLAAALAGGVLPPLNSYLADRNVPDGEPKAHPYAEPIGPMTEEQAIEYLIVKDLPERVWNYSGNRRILAVCSVNQVPSDRTFRNAWRLNQEMETEND